MPSVLDAIGATSLVQLQRLTRGPGCRTVAQLEHLHPGFSSKDRMAREMLETAEAQSHLAPGQAVVELAIGNTSTGLAIVCGIK